MAVGVEPLKLIVVGIRDKQMTIGMDINAGGIVQRARESDRERTIRIGYGFR